MKPELFTILPGKTACEWIRIIHPWRYLNRHGITARIVPESEIRSLERGLPPYNILVISRRVPIRGAEQMVDFIRLEQLRGVRVVYEIDDDPFSPRFYEHPDQLKPVLEACDGCIVTTPALAERVRPYVKPYIFRNYLDGELWEPLERFPSQEITIGISGSETHYEDWKLVDRALHNIARHPQVRFTAFGYLPDYLADLPRLTYRPPVPYRFYPSGLMGIDIGLAPLIIDAEGFNRHKSDIKALDYALAGAAALVSNHSVYRPSKGASVLVDDDEWEGVLDYYITHPHELSGTQRRGRAWVRKHRLLADGWTELAGVCRQILRS